MCLNYEIILDTLQDTTNFAADISAKFPAPITVGLIGPLGAGKTTFVAAYVKALGMSCAVSSPSYLLQHEYDSEKVMVEHWDLYRVDTVVEELLEPPDERTIRFIEWVDKVEELVNLSDVLVYFNLEFLDSDIVRRTARVIRTAHGNVRFENALNDS